MATIKRTYLLLLAVCLFACDAKKENNHPDLVVRFTTGGEMNLKEVDAQFIVILFQPDCDHCQREAQDIQRNLSSFKDYGLFFISDYNLPSLTNFAKSYQLESAKNVYFGQTDVQSIINSFGPVEAPSIFIYREGELVKHFNGETPVGQIVNEL